MILTKLSRILLGFCILGALVFLVSHPVGEEQFSTRSDEGYYYRYAQIVADRGISAFNRLIHWYSSTELAQKHPAPIFFNFA